MRSYIYSFLLFTSIFLTAQNTELEGYYLFPINPGKQNFLAGTMGELRSSHFHAGLDIKTGGVSGLPVYAAADGFISRVKIAGGGYGHVLYMEHPNGTTTVYAHLSKFEPAIAKYALEAQYEQKSFDIELTPPSTQFLFKKGDIIAYSGNTGSSSGPHLHFEIRDANQRILDPMLCKFSEIKDDITPQIQKIAFVTLEGNARVNETFGRYEFEVLKTGNIYSTRVPIKLKGKIGIEMYAYDLCNGVYNRNGIQKATLVVDGDTVFAEYKNKLSFGNQRSILVHMDYERIKEGGPKFNKLFVDDGNDLGFYETPSKGFVFSDSIHHIQIYLEDSYGNISTFDNKVNNHKIVNKPEPKIKQFEIYRNQLHIVSPHSGTPAMITVYLPKSKKTILPYREDKLQAYYLWDLRNGLPDSLDINGKIVPTKIYTMIPSAKELTYYSPDVDLTFQRSSLFDTLYLQFSKRTDALTKLEAFEFPHSDVPLNSSVRINLKPEKKYNETKARVYTLNGTKPGSYQGGEWKNGEISFSTKDLVKFTIAMDSIAPAISPRIVNTNELYFKISDDRSGIKSFKASLNGEFLLMYHEPKSSLIWAVRKDETIPLKGDFILEVEDNTGNKNYYNRKL